MSLRARCLPRLMAATATAALLLPAPGHALDPADSPDPPASERGIFTGAEVERGAGKAFDLLVLRPLGLVRLFIGVGIFIPAALLSAPDREAFPEALEIFVKLPAQSVFVRPLGDF